MKISLPIIAGLSFENFYRDGRHVEAVEVDVPEFGPDAVTGELHIHLEDKDERMTWTAVDGVLYKRLERNTDEGMRPILASESRAFAEEMISRLTTPPRSAYSSDERQLTGSPISEYLGVRPGSGYKTRANELRQTQKVADRIKGLLAVINGELHSRDLQPAISAEILPSREIAVRAIDAISMSTNRSTPIADFRMAERLQAAGWTSNMSFSFTGNARDCAAVIDRDKDIAEIMVEQLESTIRKKLDSHRGKPSSDLIDALKAIRRANARQASMDEKLELIGRIAEMDLPAEAETPEYDRQVLAWYVARSRVIVDLGVKPGMTPAMA